jgi:hypothetical protein
MTKLLEKIAFLIAVGLAVVGWTVAARAQSIEDCVAQLQQSKMAMMQKAQECNVDAADLGRVDAGYEALSPQECSAPIGVSSQLTAFNECSRVYICGIQATNCAIGLARQGIDCQTAATTCLGEHPVPQ